MIIVLGCKPYLNDNSISPELRARVGKGVELYKRGFGNKLLLTGGTVFSDMPEALVMKSLAKMVPRNDLLLEIHSNSTQENAALSKRILLRKGIKGIILVTSPYHMKRALSIFREVLGRSFSITGVQADFRIPLYLSVWEWCIEHLKAMGIFPERFLHASR